MAINTPPHIHENVVCANMFVRKGDQYLMLKRSPHKKYAPNVLNPIGGKVDPHENPLETAHRETLEEAGVMVTNVRLEAVIHELVPVKGEPYNWLIFHFSGDYAGGEVIETEEGQLLWLTPAEILEADLFPSLRVVIGHILNPDDGTVFATMRYNEERTEVIDQTVEVITR